MSARGTGMRIRKIVGKTFTNPALAEAITTLKEVKKYDGIEAAFEELVERERGGELEAPLTDWLMNKVIMVP